MAAAAEGSFRRRLVLSLFLFFFQFFFFFLAPDDLGSIEAEGFALLVMLSDAFSPSIMSRSSSGDYFSCYASWGFLGGFRPCSLDRTPDNSRVDWPATLPSFFSSMGNVPCLAVLWIRHLGHARLLQDTLHCISHSVLGLLYLVYLYGF